MRMKNPLGGHLLKVVGILGGFFVFTGIAGILVFVLSPGTSAYGADFLRNLIGDQPVTLMETVVFQAQDTLKQTEYKLGLVKASDPFGPAPALIPVSGAAPSTATALAQVEPAATATTVAVPATAPAVATATTVPTIAAAAPITTAAAPATSFPMKSSALVNVETVTPVPAASPTPANVSPAQANWMPPAVDASNQPAGAAVWQPYITDPSGRVVAYRTYILPDPTRPYVTVAIVAFDLQHVRLHYVLGTSDPYAPGVKHAGTGAIPPADLQSGMLLAAFNGGFKYMHGHFGSMLNGFTSAPPIEGMGTLAIYQDGSLRMGEWGKDILPSPDMVAFRQNGPMVIQNGQIGSQVNDSLIWGRTISGETVTWRSGLAISSDAHTLYYVAGPSLSVLSLAQAMQTVHPQFGIQLDINNYWVHFTTFKTIGGQLQVEALFPKAMTGYLDRYLHPYPKDFFYITAGQ